MARGIHEVLNGHYIISHSKCFVSVSGPFTRCLWIVDLWKPGDLFRSNVPYPRVTVSSWRLRAGNSEAVSSKNLTPASEDLGVQKTNGLNLRNKLQNTKRKQTYEPSRRRWPCSREDPVTAIALVNIRRCFIFVPALRWEKYVGAALQHPNIFPPSILTHGSRGERVFCFRQGHRWHPRAHSTHLGTGRFRRGDKSAQGTPQWEDFEWVPPQSSLQRGSLGVNLDPKTDPGGPSQHLVSPAVSPNYWLSRSSNSCHTGTRHREQKATIQSKPRAPWHSQNQKGMIRKGLK